jgi:hypothetical protein
MENICKAVLTFIRNGVPFVEVLNCFDVFCLPIHNWVICWEKEKVVGIVN